MESKRVKELLAYIEEGQKPEKPAPVHTLNALGSYPLAYRTFGGQAQGNGRLDDETLELAFGSHYLLTMLASGAVIRQMLYCEKESCHSLYCDDMLFGYLDRHGLAEHGVWDRIETEDICRNITMDNVDHRIYYSAVKPYALMAEARDTKEKIPILFVDTDLILKRRHDAILKNPTGIRAAFGHLEAVRMPCYPDFTELHFPEGVQIPKNYPINLPAVNTCLMYFNDRSLLTEWSVFFSRLFLHNHLPFSPDADVISRQLLGIDQRTFPMVAASHGYWDTDQVEAFLNIIWDPPFFYDCKSKEQVEWHYYTLEHHPECRNWHQDIMHTWINKRNIERDTAYRNYQGCMMLEMIQELEPELEKHLRTFKSLAPYLELQKDYGTIENMLRYGVVRDRLDKSC